MADIAQVKEQLKKMYEAGVRNVPITIEGPAGIGKSAIVNTLTKELEVGFIDLRLAQMADAADLVGLPRSNPDTLETVYCKPDWWPKEGTKGILFLDEPNRGTPDVIQGVFQLMTDRRIHTHKLPDGWMVVMAQNPASGDVAYAVQTVDAAWNSRSLLLEASISSESWLSWGRKNGINDMVLRFIAMHTELLHQLKEDGPFPCPRTWDMLSTLMNKGALLKEIEADMIRGLIGIEATTVFIKFMDKSYNKPVSGVQVLEHFMTGKIDRTNDGVTKKVDVREAVKKQKTDENSATVKDLLSHIGDKKELTDVQYKNLGGFITTVPKEIAMSALKKLDRSILMKLGRADKKVMDLVANIMKEIKKG